MASLLSTRFVSRLFFVWGLEKWRAGMGSHYCIKSVHSQFKNFSSSGTLEMMQEMHLSKSKIQIKLHTDSASCFQYKIHGYRSNTVESFVCPSSPPHFTIPSITFYSYPHNSPRHSIPSPRNPGTPYFYHQHPARSVQWHGRSQFS